MRAEAYDVAHFPELRDQYGAMSVPCIVITRADGTQRVEFGKKSIPQMLELIGVNTALRTFQSRAIRVGKPVAKSPSWNPVYQES